MAENKILVQIIDHENGDSVLGQDYFASREKAEKFKRISDRAIALYTRMGWQLDGSTSLEFDPKQYPTVTRKCALVQMRYAGPAQE